MQIIDGHQHPSENILGDFCDSKKYRNNTLFATDPKSLQLILYYDELEVCNPLGSHRKKHKLGM